jgi:hypothetical protein
MEMVLVYVDDLVIMLNKKELTAAMKLRFKTNQGPAECRRMDFGIKCQTCRKWNICEPSLVCNGHVD